ncbi:MAG: uncharacterized protein JWR33_1258 [Naasia sp.]|jgi:uncharacterized protein (DUF1684 family)|uniref:DUF1684 domain-containing protein n=1 Tax=Naasia sp. TaxID=2546198 RepID=UPI00260CC5F2|nr:DUF1684 domain-containing protein [Naasia sp.]MCU1570517.1 uncharacterized protein [Naasia sp.]
MTDTTTTQAAPTPTAEERYSRFRSRRDEAVVQPKGFLALVNTQWIDSEQPIWGVPGIWAPLPEGESGLKVTATAADGITVDGRLVDGEAIARGRDSPAPSEIVFSDTVSGTVIAGHDGSYGLRVWDSASDAIQQFGGIDAFDYDPSWVVSGRFAPNPDGTTAGFAHLKDEHTREMVIPGEITFEHDGTEYAVLAFKEGRALQLVFSDATSGDSTYSVGRFLFVAPNPDGTITLDFNTAVLPPCAFSYNFNCPMPPKQNRFPFPVEAGEKNVVAKSGELLH